jgi:hypothetical protein
MSKPTIFLCALAACTAPLETVRDPGLPETCRDIADATPGAVDGTYLLYLEQQPTRPWNAYCHDLRGEPREYLDLPSEAEGANRSTLSSYDGRAFGGVATRYRRVRIDPHTLEVDVSDQTFAESAGFAVVEGRAEVTAMPFGVATACSTVPEVRMQARSVIDLAGTPFALAGEFCMRDADEALSSVWRANTKGRAELTVHSLDAEVCATASPAPCLDAPFNDAGGFQLPLVYQP